MSSNSTQLHSSSTFIYIQRRLQQHSHTSRYLFISPSFLILHLSGIRSQNKMRPSYFLPIASLLLLVSADDSASSVSVTSTATMGTPATFTHEVKIGSSGLNMEPDTLTAAPGDLINFHFFAQNHSIAQSSFDKPCEPITSGTDAIFSGFFPISKGESDKVFSMRVNSTDAIWLYCSYGDHCKGGQAMVINPPYVSFLLDGKHH